MDRLLKLNTTRTLIPTWLSSIEVIILICNSFTLTKVQMEINKFSEQKTRLCFQQNPGLLQMERDMWEPTTWRPQIMLSWSMTNLLTLSSLFLSRDTFYLRKRRVYFPLFLLNKQNLISHRLKWNLYKKFRRNSKTSLQILSWSSLKSWVRVKLTQEGLLEDLPWRNKERSS
jgi:hypothetical protein